MSITSRRFLFSAKKDSCLWAASFEQFIQRNISENPNFDVAVIVTDCSPREFKNVEALHTAQTLADKFNIRIIVLQFSKRCGKYLYDPAGKQFVEFAKGPAVAALDTGSDDLEKLKKYLHITVLF